jgi:hypothetical protein
MIKVIFIYLQIIFLYSSSNNNKLDFNLINLKNIVNTQDQFTSSNNLLSTSETTIFSQNLRKYTSILSDIDSEKNETLSLNFVYNNFDITVKSLVLHTLQLLRLCNRLVS